MNQPKDNYRLLLSKLDEFIRKYYKNKAIRGGIYFSATLLVSYLIVSTFEFFGHYSIGVRTAFFYLFLLINLFVLGRFLILPLVRYARLGEIISNEKASRIIGDHFPEVRDKLLNTLQLRRMADDAGNENEKALILASVNQKISGLEPVPFIRAVNFRENKKYLKYAIVPLIILLIILFSAPQMLLESTERLIGHRKYYEIKAPFNFELENNELKAVRQEDFTLRLKTTGNEIPNNVYVVVEGKQYLMNKKSKINHEYTLRNLQDDVDITFWANGFSSRPYNLRVLPRPILQKFSVKLDYPSYIGKKDESLENTGDLTIPQGTKVVWEFNTQFIDKIKMFFGDTAINSERLGEDIFRVQKAFVTNSKYYIKTANQFMSGRDSILYFINVIPDAYPNIVAEEENDTGSIKRRFFTGEISDDYGFRALSFNYRMTRASDSAGESGKLNRIPIGVKRNQLLQQFYFSWDISELSPLPGDQIEYYFEVWDNDGVNGSKSRRSKKFIYKVPTVEELDKAREETNKEVKSDIKDAISQAQKMQKDIEEAKQKLLEKKELSWEDKKFLEKMINNQKELEKSIEEIKNKQKKSLSQQEDFEQLDPETLEKLNKLNKMFEEVMTDEMKEMFKELEELLKKEYKDQLEKELEKLNLQDQNLEKELDRMMELFKQLELEQKMEKTTEKLEKLAEKQEKLSEETEKKEKPAEELKKEQDKLNEEFEEIKEDIEEIKEMNEELEDPNNLEETKEEQQEISEEQKESSENLDQKKEKDAAKNQKKAAEKMKELSKKMQQMMQDMEMESLQLNYQKLRQILENLVHLSFEQENLINEFGKVKGYNPRYVELSQEQNRLGEDAKMIEDSLLALSKKVIQIESFVNREIRDINYHLDKTREFLSDRNFPGISTSQQYIMTHTNNLAVLLSEILEQMQDEMSQQMKGDQMCQKCKPNQGKKGKGQKMKSLGDMQKKLGEKLEQMKNGSKPGERQGATSKELAQMAAMQEQIRRQLQQLREEMQKSDEGAGGNLEKLERLMEENEEDIVNKKVNQNTLERQKEITIRMLEAEKAMKEQEFEEKRESQTADKIEKESPAAFEKYKREKQKELEMLKTVPPSLNGYYRLKVKEYFKTIGE